MRKGRAQPSRQQKVAHRHYSMRRKERRIFRLFAVLEEWEGFEPTLCTFCQSKETSAVRYFTIKLPFLLLLGRRDFRENVPQHVLFRFPLVGFEPTSYGLRDRCFNHYTTRDCFCQPPPHPCEVGGNLPTTRHPQSCTLRRPWTFRPLPFLLRQSA